MANGYRRAVNAAKSTVDLPKNDHNERRGLREAYRIAVFAFSQETFVFVARYRIAAKTNNGDNAMSQRSKILAMVTEIHEKNIVMVNILRDIVENEIRCDHAIDADGEDFYRKRNDCSVRRNEILAEIQHFLDRESLVQPMHA